MPTEPVCCHEWHRLLSDPSTPACTVCGERYDSERHNPALPDWEEAEIPAEIRSFSDLAIEFHEVQAA